MSIEIGTLAEWVSGIGGVLAAGAAVVAWRVSQRMLSVEERRDRKAELQRQAEMQSKAREQAGLVFVLGAKLPDRSYGEEWALFLFNGSTKPIFDVCVESRYLSKDDPRPELKLNALPPGQFIVPSHPKFHWGTLTDLSLSPERMELLAKGKGATMINKVKFRDANNVKWVLQGGTDLASGEEN